MDEPDENETGAGVQERRGQMSSEEVESSADEETSIVRAQQRARGHELPVYAEAE